jgi:hypothetical protein
MPARRDNADPGGELHGRHSPFTEILASAQPLNLVSREIAENAPAVPMGTGPNQAGSSVFQTATCARGLGEPCLQQCAGAKEAQPEVVKATGVVVVTICLGRRPPAASETAIA